MYTDAVFAKFIVRRTVKIGLACLGFLVGLGLARLGLHIDAWLLLGAFVLFGISFLRLPTIAVFAALTCGLIFGLWRGDVALDAQAQLETFVGQKVVLQGQVATDPTFDDKGQLDIRLQNIRIENTQLDGVVRVKSFAPTSVKRGDVVQVSGKLMNGFGNYQAAVYYAQLATVSQNNSLFETIRRHFAAVIYTNIPEPQASLGLGFLLGLKSSLPDSLSEQLKLVGLTHVVVASGYNLTILIRLARRIFERRSKYQTAAVALGLIAAFLAVTGFSPSMARAALVTSLALWAWYFGRRIHPLLLLLFAAAITAGLNPLYLLDLGWWLSFLAFAGVLILAPLLQKRLSGDKKPKFIVQIILETTAAQLLTLPLILWVFGNFAVLALVANVVVVPLVPVAMAATFAAGVIGLIASPVLSALVSWPATIILSFMTEAIKLLAGVPWASIPMPISLVVMLFMYGFLVAIIISMWHRTKDALYSRSIIE